MGNTNSLFFLKNFLSHRSLRRDISAVLLLKIGALFLLWGLVSSPHKHVKIAEQEMTRRLI